MPACKMKIRAITDVKDDCHLRVCNLSSKIAKKPCCLTRNSHDPSILNSSNTCSTTNDQSRVPGAEDNGSSDESVAVLVRETLIFQNWFGENAESIEGMDSLAMNCLTRLETVFPIANLCNTCPKAETRDESGDHGISDSQNFHCYDDETATGSGIFDCSGVEKGGIGDDRNDSLYPTSTDDESNASEMSFFYDFECAELNMVTGMGACSMLQQLEREMGFDTHYESVDPQALISSSSGASCKQQVKFFSKGKMSDGEADSFIEELLKENDGFENPNFGVVNGKKRITLVLDLDETLVHSSLEASEKADFTFPILFEKNKHTVYVRQRPFLRAFLNRVAEIFEVVVFTASQSTYARKLLDILDPDKNLFSRRAYRDSCIFSNGCYTKDLTVLGVDLARVAIVDNSPQVYRLQAANGIPIISWFDDTSDDALLRLLPFLEILADVEDVRPLIVKQFPGGVVAHEESDSAARLAFGFIS